jgi:hypothetical protein
MPNSLREKLIAENPALCATWDSLPAGVTGRVIDYARSVTPSATAPSQTRVPIQANGAFLAALLADLTEYGPGLLTLIQSLISVFSAAAIFLMLLLTSARAAETTTTASKPGYHRDVAGTEHKVNGLRPLTPQAKARLQNLPQKAPTTAFNAAAPATVDLRSKCPAPLDQDGYNCCAGCSGTMGHRLAEILAGNPDPLDSVADLYDRCNGGVDEGADLATCIHAMEIGVAPWTLVPQWEIPYESEVAGVAAARSANPLEGSQYLSTEGEMLAAVEAGKPVYFGIIVTNQFNPDEHGYIGPYGGREEGGHAILALGVSATANGGHAYIIRNSWGSNWGLAGNCLLDSSWAKPEIYGAFALTGSNRTVTPAPTGSLDSPPSPSGSGNTTLNTWYAPSTAIRPAAIALAGSASSNLYFASWGYSDSALNTALCNSATSGVHVKACLDTSGGSTTSTWNLARQLVTSGGTVYSCHFTNTIGNNFLTADGTYTLQGTYYWSPTALQIGSYVSAISGTGTATAAQTRFATLASGGTLVAENDPPEGEYVPCGIFAQKTPTCTTCRPPATFPTAPTPTTCGPAVPTCSPPPPTCGPAEQTCDKTGTVWIPPPWGSVVWQAQNPAGQETETIASPRKHFHLFGRPHRR